MISGDCFCFALFSCLIPLYLSFSQVWGEAAIHAFYSLSCCTGGLITLSSYNRFHSNLLRYRTLFDYSGHLLPLQRCVVDSSS